jgi:hypothetical protein
LLASAANTVEGEVLLWLNLLVTTPTRGVGSAERLFNCRLVGENTKKRGLNTFITKDP